MATTWQSIAASRQAYRDESISRVWPLLPPLPSNLPLNVSIIPQQLLTVKEVQLTELSPEHLLDILSTGVITSLTLTNAFLRRAGIAQGLTNCITELLPERALTRAKFLDEYLAKEKKPIGPLHGLPISVKEHIGMAGLDLNAGFCGWVGQIPTEDALILQILWKAGAVFYARTTQPQTLMHLETSSNLLGTTINGFNTNLTSGGSSGGEGALVGLRGSCLGIGTDIGGSIRSPAANNGVYGLRPTTYRLPTGGWSGTMAGEEQIVPVIGPLSTSLSGLKVFMKTIIDSKPWLTDPILVPMPWRDAETVIEEGKKIKVGVMRWDGVVMPHPPILRAMDELVAKLEASEKYEVIEWKGLDHGEAWEIISTLYFADGGAEELQAMHLTNEPILPLSNFILSQPTVHELSVAEVWSWTVKRDRYKTRYAALWGDVDVILCPAGPSTAPLLETAKWWGYTSLWNLLDYPAVVFPVSKVLLETDKKNDTYKPVNEKDTYNYELYKTSKFVDAPVSLQLVGRRFDDEKILEVLEGMVAEVRLPFLDAFVKAV